MSAPTIIWIRPGVGFVASAADSFLRLETRLGRQIDSNSTYRDYDTQMGMYLAWQAWVNGTGPRPNHSRAIHPDYSVHCQGKALDSDDWRTPGFNELAAEYGWIRTAANDPTEQHHFEYQSWRDQHIKEGAPAAAGVTIAAQPIPEPPVEEDDMLALRIAYGDRTHHVALGIGTFRHIAGTDPDKIKNVLRIQDDWQDIGLSELGQFLRTFGCDERIWDLRDTAGNPTSAGDARFCVLDPLTGSVSEGNVWTAVNALRAQVKGIEQPTIDVSPLIAAARQAVIDGLEGLTLKATKG